MASFTASCNVAARSLASSSRLHDSNGTRLCVMHCHGPWLRELCDTALAAAEAAKQRQAELLQTPPEPEVVQEEQGSSHMLGLALSRQSC